MEQARIEDCRVISDSELSQTTKEVIRILIGLDLHKRTVFVTEMNDDGSINEQYKIANDEES